MIRTQIYITEEEKNGIESVAISQGISQSKFIRLAIDDLLIKSITIDKSAILDEIAGIWSNKKEIPNIRDLRTGWRNRTER